MKHEFRRKDDARECTGANDDIQDVMRNKLPKILGENIASVPQKLLIISNC